MAHLIIAIALGILVATIFIETMEWVVTGLLLAGVAFWIWRVVSTPDGLGMLFTFLVFFGLAGGVLWTRDTLRARKNPPPSIIVRPVRPTAAEQAAAMAEALRLHYGTPQSGPLGSEGSATDPPGAADPPET